MVCIVCTCMYTWLCTNGCHHLVKDNTPTPAVPSTPPPSSSVEQPTTLQPTTLPPTTSSTVEQSTTASSTKPKEPDTSTESPTTGTTTVNLPTGKPVISSTHSMESQSTVATEDIHGLVSKEGEDGSGGSNVSENNSTRVSESSTTVANDVANDADDVDSDNKIFRELMSADQAISILEGELFNYMHT